MEDIKYIDEDIANSRYNMLVFDLNTPRFADFLLAFAEVIRPKYFKSESSYDFNVRDVVGMACCSDRLRFNFKLTYNENINAYEFKSIYRDYDGRLGVYSRNSHLSGIQCGKTNEECVKLIAKTIKQMSYCKFVYDVILGFTNAALAEINVKFDEMRRKNNGKLVINKVVNNHKYTEFSKKLAINNVVLEFRSGYEDYDNAIAKRYNANRQYAYLTVQYSYDKGKAKSFSCRYDLNKNRYANDLNFVLNKINFNKEFSDTWKADNKNPSVFRGFKIGDVVNIYNLLINNKNAIKKMDDEVKKEYIIPNQGLNPIELEVVKQFQQEIQDITKKYTRELLDLRNNLAYLIKDAKKNAINKMEEVNVKVLEKYWDEVKKRNKILSDSGCNYQLSEVVPASLLQSKKSISYFD